MFFVPVDKSLESVDVLGADFVLLEELLVVIGSVGNLTIKHTYFDSVSET